MSHLRRAALVAMVSGMGARGASAQRPALTLADIAGTWNGTFMTGATDSAIATFILTATADRDGWTLLLPGHPPHPTRVVALAGDNVVTETGPYPSTRMPGQTVTTRMTFHVSGDALSGSFWAHYSAGDTRGKITAQRGKV